MCNCPRPNINGTPGGYRWNNENPHTYQVNPPDLADGDTLVYDLPGRCGGTDSHSHHFRVVHRPWGGLVLLTRNGSGDHAHDIGTASGNHRRGVRLALEACADDEARYWLCQTLYHTFESIASAATNKERTRWNVAAAQGRLKLRSKRGAKYAEIVSPLETV